MEESQTEVQTIVFVLEKSFYCVDIMRVQEIIKMSDISELPQSPDYIRGIVNLRGKIIPVIDLRRKFGFEKSVVDKNWKILILKHQNARFGIMVEEISEVEKISLDIIEPPPKVVTGINAEYIQGIAKTEKRLLLVLNIDKVLENQ